MLMITPCTGKFITTEDSILPSPSYKPQLTVRILTCRQKTLITLSLFARHNPRTTAQAICGTTSLQKQPCHLQVHHNTCNDDAETAATQVNYSMLCLKQSFTGLISVTSEILLNKQVL